MGLILDLEKSFRNYDSSIKSKETLGNIIKCYDDIKAIQNRPDRVIIFKKEQVRVLDILRNIQEDLKENPSKENQIKANDEYQAEREKITGLQERLKGIDDEFSRYERKQREKERVKSKAALEEERSSIRKQVIQLLKEFRFENADEVYENDSEFIGEEWYKNKKDEYHVFYKRDREKKKLEVQQESIIIAFKNYDFDLAYSIFEESKCLDKSEYDKLKQEAFDRVPFTIWNAAFDNRLDTIEKLMSSRDYGQIAKERFEQYVRIIECLRQYEFSKADDAYEKLKNKPAAYNQFKAKMICEYLSSKGMGLDEEKGLALADTSKYILLKARAGSGKTRAVACKTVLLCEKYGLKPDEIMILAFNSAAATEIRSRIQKTIKLFNSGRTYHSFAKEITGIDVDKDVIQNDFKKKKKTERDDLIKDVINTLLQSDATFVEAVYSFFHKEMEEPEEDDTLGKEGYDMQREEFHLTLSGDEVKSKGEKYISDFFFEHDISVIYEKRYDWKKKGDYKPDFTIQLKSGDVFILEHWGIDESDEKGKKVAPNWNKTWDKYHKEIQDKRAYWKNRPETLIETSICDMKVGRDKFEKTLKERLEQHRIDSTKLPEEDLLSKFRENNAEKRKKKLFQLFESFIDRAKNGGYDVKALEHKISLYRKDVKSSREWAFLECGSLLSDEI